MCKVTSTNNFQYQSQFIDSDSIPWWDQGENVQITDLSNYWHKCDQGLYTNIAIYVITVASVTIAVS